MIVSIVRDVAGYAVTKHEAADLVDCLEDELGAWPAQARIYRGGIDVTPVTADEADALACSDGDVVVVLYPGVESIIAIGAAIGISVSAATATVIANVAISLAISATISIVQMALTPDAPGQRNKRYESPNNGLAQRVNTHDIGGRISDIYGRLRAVPNLVAMPYTTYIDHAEVEHNLMVVGRGKFAIHSIKDDTTAIDQIAGASVAVYQPYTSPNNASPSLLIGNPITDKPLVARRHNGINGQTLRPNNSFHINGNNNIKLVAPNEIQSLAFDFPARFFPGDQLIITESTLGAANYNGTYTVASVSSGAIVLDNPAAVNAAWSALSGSTAWFSPRFHTAGDKWVGAFVVDDADAEWLYCNIVAASGLYKDDGYNQQRFDVDVLVEVVQLGGDGFPVGSPLSFPGTVAGSDLSTQQRALTLKVQLPFVGRCQVRFKRVTPTDLDFAGSVVDEIKIKDLYVVTKVGDAHFGDATMIQSVTTATAGALAIKERKLIVDCTRVVGGKVSARADDIIIAMCKDSRIGRMADAEIDEVGIRSAVAQVAAYFGSDKAISIGYSFDDDTAFEGMIASVAQAVFCTPVRVGSVVTLRPDLPGQLPTLLFNHRNILPGTLVRSVRFGAYNNHDGVEVQYKDADGMAVTYHYPENQSAINPKKIDIPGLICYEQAYIHARRAYNKIRYQNQQVEFTGTHEASMLARGDKVMVADGTRSGTRDGEVIGIDGMVLELSQEVVFAEGDCIYLQNTDGSIDVVDIVGQVASNKVRLERQPAFSVQSSDDNYAKTTYLIASDSAVGYSWYTVTDRAFDTAYTSKVVASNFDERFYSNDKDLAWT